MRYLFKILLFLALSIQACKKDKPAPPVPSNPDTTAKWVLYNSSNSALSNNQVNAIAIDKNDVKWIGTADGLIQIKGAVWTVFNNINSPLPSSFIRALAVESEGTLWVGTDAGLARFSKGQWSVYTRDNSILESNSITCMTYDAKNKLTYIGTDEGIIKIDSNNSWEFIYVSDLTLSLATDLQGNLWAGVFNPFAFAGKIRKYTKGQWVSYSLPDIGYASAFPYSLTADLENNIYTVLSGTSTSCVIRFKDNVWKEIEKPENARGLKVVVVQDNRVWVGGNTLTLCGNEQSSSFDIPRAGSNIQAMALDSKGRKWLGTIRDGLAVYND